jgi:hypothetical protein
MHLRRALLLFAIVLGLTALATSMSRPPEQRREPAPRPQAKSRTPTAAPARAGPPAAQLRFGPAGDTTRRVALGQQAVVTVEVPRPGEVELEGLGLSAPAEPLTPARFDVLAREPGRYAVVFAPAGEDERIALGTLTAVAGRR